MVLARDVLSITKWDADLPSGELYLKLEMDYHQRQQSKRMPMDSQNMELFANKMVLFPLLSLKFCKMVIMI